MKKNKFLLPEPTGGRMKVCESSISNMGRETLLSRPIKLQFTTREGWICEGDSE